MRRSRTEPRRRPTVTMGRWLAGALAACAPAPASPAPPRCPTAPTVIASQADIARLAGCATLGGVTIRSGGALDLSALRALTTITGDLVIGPTVAVAEVSLSAVRAVGGDVGIRSNGMLQGVFLPALERAGSISVDGNVAITTLSLPRLVAIPRDVRVTGNASLELIDLSALTSIGGDLVLDHDPALVLVESGELRAVGRVELDLPKLAPEIADRLRALASEAARRPPPP